MRISLNSAPTLNQTSLNYELSHGTPKVNYSTMASHLPWYKFVLHNKIAFSTDGETELLQKIFLMHYIALLPSLLRHFEFQCLYLLQTCCYLGKLKIKFTLMVLLMLMIFKTFDRD